jgi:hypothetical protein
VWDYPALAGLVMFLTGVGAVLTVLAAVLGADWVIGGVLTVGGVLVVVGLLVLAQPRTRTATARKTKASSLPFRPAPPLAMPPSRPSDRTS